MTTPLGSPEHFYSPDRRVVGPPYLTAESPAKSRYQKPTKYLENPDAIVIGSGIGGLSMASILAQKKGWKVLILEANEVPGGCTHCHELGGFEFNSGIDSIGDMDPTIGRGMFRQTIDYVTGGQLEWAQMPDLHEVCAFGDDVYNWYSSPEKNIAWVEKQFPNQGRVRDYYALESAVEASVWAWVVTKLLPDWVPTGLREFFYKLMGGKWRRYMNRPVADVFKNVLGFSDKLTSVFSYMYGNHGRSPALAPFSFHSANLFHYRTGAYYPVGGPGQIAECIIPIVENAGGQMAVRSRVKRIIVENGTAKGVELTSGEVIYSKCIVSDASAHTTFMEFLDPEISKQHGYPERFKEIGPSPSHVYLFLGYDEAIDLPPQIYWHMPTYEGVDRYDLDAADALYKGKATFKGMGGYLLSPSARDPVYAERYPNKSTVIVLAEAIPEWVERAKTDPTFAKNLNESLVENLTKIVYRYMPQLKGKTPAFTRAGIPMGCSVGAWHGCSLGLEPSGERFVKHTHWLRPKTPIKGLWLTGQDAFSAGFCGSMLGARITYAAMTGNWLFMLKSFMNPLKPTYAPPPAKPLPRARPASPEAPAMIAAAQKRPTDKPQPRA